MLRQGQTDGEFRDFDVRVLAATVQRAVEALPFQFAAEPDLDCTAWAHQLVVLVDLATRAPR